MLRLVLAALVTLNILFALYAVFIDQKSVVNDRTERQIASSQVVIVPQNKAGVKSR